MTADAFRESSLKAVVTKFRAEQKQALLHLITGRDVFINLPTGFGKSPIYQLAPSIVEEMSHLDGKIRSAIVLVISRSRTIFAVKGIKASFISGGQCEMGLTSLHELYGS